jgi:nicotinamidase-related amidase
MVPADLFAALMKPALALIEAFRSHDLPVVLVNVDGVAPGRTQQSRRMGDLPAGWDQLLPDLNQQSSDHLVTKRTWGAFTNTDLEAYLKDQGVTQVVIIGVSTSAGVESTARFAYELGFNVTLAVDAMMDMSPETHAHSINTVFPRLGETATAAEIIGLLDANFA